MKINGYELNIDEGDIWIWSNDCFDIFATPQWEGDNDNLQIEIIHRKDQEQTKIFSIPWSGPKDLAHYDYLGLINAITTLLNASQKERKEERDISNVPAPGSMDTYYNPQTPWLIEVTEKTSLKDTKQIIVGPFLNLIEADQWISRAAELWPLTSFKIFKPEHKDDILP